MAIFYHKFQVPAYGETIHDIDLEAVLLFAKHSEIPSDHTVDITPDGYDDQYILKTHVDDASERYDTTGELHVVRVAGERVVALPMERGGIPGGYIETEAERTIFTVDRERPIILVARHIEHEGNVVLRLDGIIEYVESGREKSVFQRYAERSRS